MTDLAIIGMRGTGKSNVTRRLSVMTKRPVLATDLLVEFEAGCTISEIVSSQGWRAFRQREFDVIRKVCAFTKTLEAAPANKPSGALIDCGGGVLVDLDESGAEIYSSRKMDLLKARGPVVWLRGDITRLAAKTSADLSRPSLDAARSAEEIMRRREPLYQRCADVIIDIEGKTRAEITHEIHARFAGELWPSRDFGAA